MESKGNKSSSALLLGLSFNLILTLGSLGFTCYSLHRFDSRLTTVEQDLLAVNHPDQLANRGIVKPTSTHSLRNGIRRKEVVSKRAVDRPSTCRKCSRSCLNANHPGNVSSFSLLALFLIKVELFVYDVFLVWTKSALFHFLDELINKLFSGTKMIPKRN